MWSGPQPVGSVGPTAPGPFSRLVVLSCLGPPGRAPASPTPRRDVHGRPARPESLRVVRRLGAPLRAAAAVRDAHARYALPDEGGAV